MFFKKSYFYCILWKNEKNEKITSSGILENMKKVKNNEDLKEAIYQAIIEIESDYEDDNGIEFIIDDYELITFNLV